MKNSQGKKGEYAAELVYKVQLANGKSCFYPIHYYCFIVSVKRCKSCYAKKDLLKMSIGGLGMYLLTKWLMAKYGKTF